MGELINNNTMENVLKKNGQHRIINSNYLLEIPLKLFTYYASLKFIPSSTENCTHI